MSACEYTEHKRACREDAVWDVRMLGRKVRLCDRHARPEFHPRDVRERLADRVRLAPEATP